MSFDFSKIDVDKLKTDVGAILFGALKELVDGAEKDIKMFANEISRDLLESHLTGQKAITIQLLNQLKVLAEINNVRVRERGWHVAEAVVEAIFNAVVSGVFSVLL